MLGPKETENPGTLFFIDTIYNQLCNNTDLISYRGSEVCTKPLLLTLVLSLGHLNCALFLMSFSFCPVVAQFQAHIYSEVHKYLHLRFCKFSLLENRERSEIFNIDAFPLLETWSKKNPEIILYYSLMIYL